jgi:hypothetical protein
LFSLDDIPRFRQTMSLFALVGRPRISGLLALTLTLLGWLWFAVCFTARASAWWNSLALSIVIYALALILSIRGIRSIVGIFALLLAIPSLGVVCILAFGR